MALKTKTADLISPENIVSVKVATNTHGIPIQFVRFNLQQEPEAIKSSRSLPIFQTTRKLLYLYATSLISNAILFR